MDGKFFVNRFSCMYVRIWCNWISVCVFILYVVCNVMAYRMNVFARKKRGKEKQQNTHFPPNQHSKWIE